MFHTSVRVRPGNERCSFDPLGRSTRTLPSLTETRIAEFSTRVSSDLPLLPETVWSETVPVTPVGILTGSLPILLMGSPNVTHDLATEARLGCFLTGHDAMRRRENDDSEAAQDTRDLGLAGVHAQPGLADAAQPGEGLAPRALRLEGDVELLTLLDGRNVVRRDIAFFFEDARNLDADPRCGDRHPPVSGGVRVADPGQHVGDAIGAHDSLLTMTTSSRPGPVPARTDCGSRYGRCRTSACTRAGVHRDCSCCAVKRRACGGVARG